MFWNLINFMAIVYLLTVTPFNIAFSYDSFIFTLIETVLNIFFIIDIFINMITSYRKKDGEWEVQNKKIVINYLKSYFLIDVVTSIPFDLIPIDNYNNNPFNKLLRILKLPKVIL